MLQSNLYRRIALYESLEKLNKDGLLEAMRLYPNVLGRSQSRQVKRSTSIKSIFLDSDKMTNVELENYQNSIQNNLVCNNKYNVTVPITNQEQQVTQTLKNGSHEQLPNDLLMKIAICLNKRDIFMFEQCCRLFYKIVNNTSFLNQCYNYDTFVLTDKILNQMVSQECSYFKYSKASELGMWLCMKAGLGHKEAQKRKAMNEFVNLWGEAKIQWKKQGWFESIFQSIKILKFDIDSMFLLDKMPLQLLFDPVKSHLETIEDLCYLNLRGDTNYFTIYLSNTINQFTNQYQHLRNTHILNQTKIRKLKCIKQHSRYRNDSHDFHSNKGIPLRDIDTDHMLFENMKVDLNQNLNFNVKVLTFVSNVVFLNNTDNSNGDNSYNIQTLRLMNFVPESSGDICNNQFVIESLNLQQSLSNLIVDIDFNKYRSKLMIDLWRAIIESIINKDHFQNVQNVNLLLGLDSDGIKWMFNLLKDNYQWIQYQFKQLTVAVTDSRRASTAHQDLNKAAYHAFQIDPQANNIEQFLDKHKLMCNEKYNTRFDKNIMFYDHEKISTFVNLASQWCQ